MKTTLNVVARIAIIILALNQAGLFKFMGSLPKEKTIPYERQRILTDSMRKIAQPIVKRADSLASIKKYTEYQYFDDMTTLSLIEKKFGFNAYSSIGILGTIDHLWQLSFKNGFNHVRIDKAKAKFLPRIDPRYREPAKSIDWKNALMIFLFWFLCLYLKILPFAFLWYLTQLIADKRRVVYLRKNPIKVLGMLLIYPYTLFWGVLRKTSDAYDHAAVMAELGRRGIKASRKDAKHVLTVYRNSGAKSLREFLDQRGFVVKRSMFAGLCITIFFNISLSKVQGTSLKNTKDKVVIENSKAPPGSVGDQVKQITSKHLFQKVLEEPLLEHIVILFYRTMLVWRDSVIKVFDGFPRKIGHVPLCYWLLQNNSINTKKHEKNHNNNYTILRWHELLCAEGFSNLGKVLWF